MKEINVKDTLLRIYLLSRFVIRTCKKLDKEKTLIFTIMALIEEKPRTIRELADLLTVNHSFMSTVVSRMEKAGLVKKQIYKDQRYRQIVLAPKGKEARKMIADEGYKLADILFKNLTEEDIFELDELLSKLNMDYKEMLTNVDFDYKTLSK